MKPDRGWAATLAIIFAGVAWGIISIFIRKLSAGGLSLPEIVFTRMLFSALFLGGYLVVFDRKKFKIAWKDLWLFIGSGIVCLVGFNCCYFYTVIRGYAAVGGVLLYTSPAFIMLFSALLFREKITKSKLAALLLTVSGGVLVSGIYNQQLSVPWGIVVSGVASGLLYGLYSIFGKIALRKYDTLTLVFYTFATGTAGCLLLGDLPHTLAVCCRQPDLLPYLIGCSVICTVLPYFMYTWGLNKTTAGRASILVAVEPLICAVMGMAVYGEDHHWLRICGVAAILSAIVLLNLPSATADNEG